MKTLKGTVLSILSYSQTQKLCAEHPTVFDCDWGLWRDKAMADFEVSKEFFDLVPQLPGSQRYLQIKSYVTFTPDMTVRVYEDGFIEGVYEAYIGYLKAVGTRNKAMEAFFANRLKPNQVSDLNKQGILTLPIQPPLALQYIEALNSSKDYKSDYIKYTEKAFYKGLANGDKSKTFLNLVLTSGRTDWIDQIIHRYFVLPEGFSIESYIEYVPFWAKEFPIYDLPLYTGEWYDAQELLSSAIKGANVRVVDFFRSIFRNRMEELSYVVGESNKHGLDVQKKPEETFGIYKRFKHVAKIAPFMLEQTLDMELDFLYLIKREPGNIPNLLVSLPFLDRDDLDDVLKTLASNYPLSTRIIQEYLSG
ncbi:Hypothetical protein BQ3484_96 [Cedratvirus A11]|uniref:Uncharacterized protein n=1 Tax=Cedratvirus A11 TaxID=1903266 RepID=A0A1M7XU01_9VIRU|nr:Hypothetical protein BQ3484_96 [Cedratvirus A11]SHO33164.1 Hypothetical protein BQ3484_96 [Cedratvirus A11]